MSINTMAACYVGTIPAVRVYLGGQVLWEKAAPKLTVQGTSFSPELELVAESTANVGWFDETGTEVATGPTPAIAWGDAGPHTVWLVCDKPGDIETLNLGFHSEQDNGLYSLPATYNRATQPVTAIENLQYLSGLRRFMAARTNGTSQDGSLYTGPLLGGALDFSGMSTLEYIECFQADVQSVDLTGCSSLIRLCVEQCDIATLDLNPVRATLRDLRAAFQRDQALTLTPPTGPLASLYHFCTRRQALTGMPDVETALPAVQQVWVWNNALNVPEMAVRSSADLHSIILSTPLAGGTPNTVASLDLAGQTWATLAGDPPRLEAEGIGLAALDMTGMGPLGRLYLSNNALNEAAIDAILTTVESWDTDDGILELQNNVPPSSAGLALVATLEGRGWNVSHDVGSTLLWADEFDTDTSASWLPGTGETDTSVSITGGRLIWSGTAGYRRIYNAAGGTLPDDLEVRLGFTLATTGGGGPGAWWGVMGRFTGSTGVRALFRGSSTLVRIGNAINATDPSSGDTDVSGTLPSGWDDAGPHELALRMVGPDMTLFYDGQFIASRFGDGLPDLAGAGVGICGQPQGRAWDYIRVYAVT